MGRMSLVLGLLVLVSAVWMELVLSVEDHLDDANRRFLLRNVPIKQCRNTKQGRYIITDDRGYLCTREKEDPMTGCCTSGDQYSCETCQMPDRCCLLYEACVSCCLAPEHDAIHLFPKVYRAPGHQETGRWADEFEYCRGKCRSHGRSTVHENAYIDERHFCFSQTALPVVTEPQTTPLPEGIQIAAGNSGEDCNSVCGDRGLRCVPEFFPSLNSCNLMRNHFPCEAACSRAAADEPQEAMYVTPQGSKTENPAVCFVGPVDAAFDSNACDWDQTHVRRLCPCGEGPTISL